MKRNNLIYLFLLSMVLFFSNIACVRNVNCHTEIDSSYRKVDVVSLIHVFTPADVEIVRTNIIDYFWPGSGFPADKMPENVTTFSKHKDIPEWIRTIGSGNLGQVDRFDIAMDYQMHSYAYHLHPKEDSVNRLLIFQMGHSSDILTAGGRDTINYFLDRGFDVVTFWMPLFGENTRSAHDIPGHGSFSFETGTYGHNQMSTMLDNSEGSFIRFFIEPVIVVINYVKSNYNYLDINMTGVSGGGWTTHICAAIDPRIELSFPVAGSLPLYLREGPCANGSLGDSEQFWPALYEEIASWPDIYILGGYGVGRGQIHILNQYDTCCFWGVNYKTFESHVTKAVKKLGSGYYDVYLDSSHAEHKISVQAIEKVIYPAVDKHLTTLGKLSKKEVR